MRLALYQPEIPQNTGTLMRLGACLGVPLDVIEPCGFVWNDQKLRRAGMDYIELANVTRHVSWVKFWQATQATGSRIVLLDAQAKQSFVTFKFQPTDILLLGQESSGVPETVATQVDAQVLIPMLSGCRSLNVAVSAAMVLTEALRQTNQFPTGDL
ncbi:tRNA (cytidine(34)-2'-O)-methyltransferase [Candidatus Paracaedibacter symbiosus]|uniref:tRNA (cytidine(34)-2'-O)-methyltransferase n=1 Tax=Candidatus Paracaedibacter symbiosus TaxID=244582 RepID=UPI0005099ADA|nr:tRNA (cytidine(34)-2'-O)-methyltransferase [Candidatus Paracaedibacter symbiosus]